MINFNRYLDQQTGEDNRSFIIHFPANSGKTAFAKNAATQRPGVFYLDLQETFLSTTDLPPILQCGFSFLRDYLIGLQISEEFVLVDNPDFLFNTWRSEDKQALLHWIKVQLRSPVDSKKTFVFFIQNDEILATSQFINTYGQPRVLSLNEFEAM
jgi:ABC-type Fe3+-hydroxamate transport system substrate-binding protein